MTLTPVALIAANRLKYFKQTLDSMLPQLEGRDLVVFIDHCGSELIQHSHKRYVKERVPGAEIILRKENFGCGRNMIDARRHMFDVLGYERSFICEDDGVLSPYYFKLCENLLEFCNSNYPNVGVVQAYSKNHWVEAQIPELKNHIEKTYDHLWGYLMTKETWGAISPSLYEYEQRFLKSAISYRQRDHLAIWEWLKAVDLTTIPEPSGAFPPHPTKSIETIMQGTNSGQDIVTCVSLEYNKIARVTTTVSRLTYVGEYGVHFNPVLFKKNGFDKIEGLVDGDDAKVTNFKVKTRLP